ATHAPIFSRASLSLHAALPICAAGEQGKLSLRTPVNTPRAGNAPSHPADNTGQAGHVLPPGQEAALVRAQAVLAAYVHHAHVRVDRKSTRLNSSHVKISYAVCC